MTVSTVPNAESHVDVGGFPIYLGSRASLSHLLLRHVESRSGLWYLVTLNPELAQLGYRDPQYMRALKSARLITCDGVGVQFMATLLAGRKPHRICGSDLIHDLAEIGSRIGGALALVGGSQESNNKAVAQLRGRYPSLRVEGWSPDISSSGMLDAGGLDAFDRRIEKTQPTILVACLGSPKQEFFLANHRELLQRRGVRIIVGLGGTVDFVAGTIPRAPNLLRRLGMEWLFRVSLQPRRMTRLCQNTLPYFISALRFRNKSAPLA